MPIGQGTAGLQVAMQGLLRWGLSLGEFAGCWVANSQGAAQRLLRWMCHCKLCSSWSATVQRGCSLLMYLLSSGCVQINTMFCAVQQLCRALSHCSTSSLACRLLTCAVCSLPMRLLLVRLCETSHSVVCCVSAMQGAVAPQCNLRCMQAGRCMVLMYLLMLWLCLVLWESCARYCGSALRSFLFAGS